MRIYILILFIISSFLFSNEKNDQNEKTHYPKRIINEPFDDSKGWFFYKDSIFINNVFNDVLNNLDTLSMKKSRIAIITIKNESIRKSLNSINVSYYMKKSNWKLYELIEWDVLGDTITCGVFLAELQNDQFNAEKVLLFFDISHFHTENKYLIRITATAPESLELWNGYKINLCRNCN